MIHYTPRDSLAIFRTMDSAFPTPLPMLFHMLQILRSSLQERGICDPNNNWFAMDHTLLTLENIFKVISCRTQDFKKQERPQGKDP